MICRLVIVMVLLAAVSPALAFRNDQPLEDPALEARAADLFTELRCLVCQNQSIAESDADLARDLRQIVRERLAAGDSDDQVEAYLVARYGDFVLLRPPVKPATYLLWFAPALLVIGAGIVVAFYFRRIRKRRASAPAGLDADEQARLQAMLDKEDS